MKRFLYFVMVFLSVTALTFSALGASPAQAAPSAVGAGQPALDFNFYATAVTNGNGFTCALTTYGGVKCWGKNAVGQLGDGTTTNSVTPVDVTGLTSGVAAISAGDSHVCALTAAGGVKCWGYNAFGQLGDSTTASSSTPVDVSGLLSGVAAISVGATHSCALTTAGGIKCWGNAANGRLGDGSTSGPISTPVDVTGLTSGVAAVSAGGSHTCAVTTSTGGGVKCWGSNSNGQLGDGTTTQSPTPVNVSGLLSGIAAISAGASHTCALTTGGGVKCWGKNSSGQLGDDTATERTAPVDVSGLTSGVASISAGFFNTCARTTGGVAKCWGGNANGQLGDGTTTTRYLPTNVSGLTSGGAAVSAGRDHACALTTGGRIKCWGKNTNGELGDGSTTDSSTPVNASGVRTGAAALATGGNHTCALTPSGGVKCWGIGMALGDGSLSPADSFTPVDVVAVGGGPLLLSGVAAISAGQDHTCALTTGGGVKCWGGNLNRQLGDGTTTDSSTPVNVSGLSSGVAAISAGGSHTCALTTSGGVKCWGGNSDGQLGNGATAGSVTAPVDVLAVGGGPALLSGVAAISAGFNHTCALTTSGGVVCWGSDANEQLGNATSSSHISTPVNVSGLLSGVIAISAGGNHTCALTTGGDVKCWGSNFNGQLGDGTTITKPTPVAISGLSSGVVAISSGGYHTCALTAGSGVKCWGNNFNGQLGDGSTTIDRHTSFGVSTLKSSALTVLLSVSPSLSGAPINFTATVSGAAETPSGTVQFKIDGANFGASVTLASGSATSSNTTALTLPTGAHLIQAVYSGDDAFAATTSAGVAQIVMADTPPIVNSFAAPTVSQLAISITAFTALDNIGVTGYKITESSTPPGAGDAGWTATPPTTYTVSVAGPYTLYPWAKDAQGNVSAIFACASVTVETTPPTVTSIVRANGTPSSAAQVDFTVTFSEPVTGVAEADFKLTNTIITNASITAISGSGATRTVTVHTGTGNGTIRLDVPATATIQDVAGNALVASYAGGEVYTINKGTAPTVPVLGSPLTGALVTSTPTLNWGDSKEVMGLATLGWHYEIQVTAPFGVYNQTFNTVDNADSLIGLGASQYTFVTPLPANTTFTWRVRAYNNANQYSAWSATWTFRTKLATPVLNSPANALLPALNNKRPTFEWDAVSGATSYTLQIFKKSAITPYPFTVLVNTGTIIAPAYTYTPAIDLLPSTQYQWKVKANGLNAGDYSAPFTFTTSANPPALPVLTAPLDLALLANNPAQVLDWNASLGLPAAVSYEVEYANNSTFTGATFVTNTVAAPTTQLPAFATLPGRTYYWRVRAWSLAGATGNHSAWTTRSFKVKFVAPTLTSPANAAINVGVGNGNRPTFTWSSVNNGIWTSYTLQVANDAAFTVGLRTFTIGAPATTYTIPNTLPALTAGLKRWRVRINGLYLPIFSAPRTFTP